jgi:hypothetical protein
VPRHAPSEDSSWRGKRKGMLTLCPSHIEPIKQQNRMTWAS